MRRASTSQLVTIVLGWATTLASSSPAHAGNEAHVRTPVLWPSSECAVIVDRSVDPIVHFDYAIPLEDTALTQDELVDSRTHQFVALCHERALSDLLPNWITRDDVERSIAAGLLEPTELAAEAILDESPLWSDCFVRVTADDDRRPITFAQAATGFDWDTSDLAVGVWSIAGHTFEPPFNLWRDRPGFVKIVDDPADPEQDLPAIALLGEELLLEPGDPVEFDACVDVLPPATVELEWAEWAPELVWQPLSVTAVTDDGPLRLAFTAPSEAADREILLRARLIDALGRKRLTYLPARLSILPCPAAGCVEPTETDPADSGCACVTPPRPLAIGLVLLPLLLRRRRSAT